MPRIEQEIGLLGNDGAGQLQHRSAAGVKPLLSATICEAFTQARAMVVPGETGIVKSVLILPTAPRPGTEPAFSTP